MLLSTKLLKTICPSLKQYDLDELEKGLNAVGIEIEEVIFQTKNDQLKLCLIKEVTKHPTKPNLNVCQVVLQDQSELQIVCGADNVKANMCAVLAPVGSHVKGIDISERDLYGVKSQGMLCAYNELSPHFSQYLSKKENDEIILLPRTHFENFETNINDLLGLDDVILDLFLPTNRNELNGVYLLANELKAFFNQPFEFEDLILKPLENVKINLQSHDVLGFNLFSFQLIRAYEQTSWHWKKFLVNSGIHVTNSLADLANFVTLLTANPIHLYDAKKVDLNSFEVKNLDQDVKFKGLDEKEYTLNKGDLIAQDKNGVLALVGIMGGESSKISDKTTHVLCEIADFNPQRIKATANRLKINSQASNLFSKPLSSTLAGIAWITVATLAFKAYANGFNDLYHFNTYHPIIIPFKVDKLNAFLGTHLDKEEVRDILERTGFKFENDEVHVPSYRTDVSDFQDVAEEILKSININDFKPQIMLSKPHVLTNILSIYDQYQKVRNVLLSKQINEVKTYNLTSKEDVNKFNWFKINDFIEIKNPISKEHAVLRVNMLNQMIDVLAYNINRKQPLVNIFEIQKLQKNLEESFDCLNVVLTTDFYKNLLDQSVLKHDLLFLKGLLSLLVNELKLDPNAFSYETNVKLLETYEQNTVAIKYQNQVVGYFAQLKKSILKPYHLDHTDVYALVLNLSQLYKTEALKETIIKPVSNFNPVYRDLSFYVQNHFELQALIADLLNVQGITDVQLTDVFNKDKHVSYTLSLKIQDFSHTLTSEEINDIYNQALDVLKKHGLTLKNG